MTKMTTKEILDKLDENYLSIEDILAFYIYGVSTPEAVDSKGLDFRDGMLACRFEEWFKTRRES